MICYKSYVTRKAEDLKWILKIRINICQLYSEGPSDSVTNQPKKITDIDIQGTGHYLAMFANYDLEEVLHTL